ncbi:BLUF domain-containing protein [Oceanicoccus sagamiensis]|uniref:BLUF domain-containing protein n=1 Tax=Oceanicoccus sagamiensis TaxID=716816 RepID=A0A1X9N9R1_9GAMM|nr:BLUF domain-containing protein [Oceanicoccus sagamiensis]ARN74818.1 hypothetical protein BST96_12240 [Oceanicoccus sagamiensis]
MYRLVYKSRSAGVIDWDTVEAIMHSSEANNDHNEISGTLLASRTHFLQIIEGKYEDVNDTFMRICHDKRHTRIQLIAFHPVDARLFDGWNMKGIGVFDFNQDIEQTMIEKYGTEEQGVKFPLEEWMVLAMVQDISLYLNIPEWKQ